jgi:hypothetical protein
MNKVNKDKLNDNVINIFIIIICIVSIILINCAKIIRDTTTSRISQRLSGYNIYLILFLVSLIFGTIYYLYTLIDIPNNTYNKKFDNNIYTNNNNNDNNNLPKRIYTLDDIEELRRRRCLYYDNKFKWNK